MIDISELIESLESSLGAIVKAVKDFKIPAPVIHNKIEVPKQEQKAPTITVNVPQQKAPVIDIRPNINVQPAKVDIPASQIQMLGAKGWVFEFEYDKFDRVTTITSTRVD